ncbi:MAG: hypothetical protein WC095_00620 [Candidatus Paceibacterota bacterium]
MTLKKSALSEYGHLSPWEFFTKERLLRQTSNTRSIGQMIALLGTNTGRLGIKPFYFICQCRGICTIKDIIDYIKKGKNLSSLPGMGRKTAKVFMSILYEEGLL